MTVRDIDRDDVLCAVDTTPEERERVLSCVIHDKWDEDLRTIYIEKDHHLIRADHPPSCYCLEPEKTEWSLLDFFTFEHQREIVKRLV